jgi:hypothetical protein
MSANASEQMRIEAMRYVAEVRYAEAFDQLMAVAVKPDEDALKENALVACAMLKPGHPSLTAELDRLIVSADSRAPVKAARILFGWVWRDEANTDPQKTSAAKLLRFVVNAGSTFSVGRNPEDQTFGGIALTTPDRRMSVRITLAQFRNFAAYFSTLREAANRGDLGTIKRFLVGSRPDVAAVPLYAAVQLGPASVLKVTEDGTGRSVDLRAADTRKVDMNLIRAGDKIEIHWEAQDGSAHRGALDEVSGSDLELFGSRDL